MPVNNKWLHTWMPSLVVLLLAFLTYAYSVGTITKELETKTDTEKVMDIVNKEIRNHTFPLSKGNLLEGRYDDIKKSLDKIEEQKITLNNTVLTFAQNVVLKQRSRTTANKNITMPDLAINPWSEPGVRYTTPIKELKR